MTTFAALLWRNLLLLFFVSLAIGNALSANPIPKTQPKLPERLPEGVYLVGGGTYKLSWTGPVLLVEPTGDIGPWNGEGRMIDGKLEIRWQYVDGRPAVGTYTLSADRRSAVGHWQWVGDETQLPESITPPAPPAEPSP